MSQLKRSWKNTDGLHRTGVALVVAAVVMVAVMSGFKHMSASREAGRRERDIAVGPRVRVVPVTPSSPERKLVLNGEARPFQSVTLYAKVSGYLRDVKVDKGDSVQQGQLLARIEAPETTREYEGAGADAKNKRAVAERLRPLLEKKLISQQEADAAFADAAVAESRAQSLGAVNGYQEIRAPFSGTVTARFADPGALVQSAANSQSALALFTLSQLNRVRIYVFVDQKDAALIHKGLPVQVSMDERPGVKIDAVITRFSGELDPKTRMLLAEVDLDNRENALVPGSFVSVSLSVKAPSYLQVPVEALVVRQAKDCVAVLTSSGTVSYRPVTVADNDGDHVKILSGLAAGEMVALNVGNSLEEGARVQPILPPPPAPPAGAAPASAVAPAAPAK